MKETLIAAPEMSSDAGLALDGITHFYGGRAVVRNLSLHVGRGELVCLLGPSGCGKTTTLRIAAGLERSAQGSVAIDGAVVSDARRHLPPEDRKVGFLFQDFALFPHLSVAGNIAFGLRQVPSAEQRQRIREVLEQVDMEGYEEAFPHMLSGGQQQRVALARAMAPKPRLMLLDEPFSGLDSRLRDQVRDKTLHVLKDSGISALMVTHDPEEAMFMADRIALMREGYIVQSGRPADLYMHPANGFVAAFFGEVNRLRAVVSGQEVDTPFGRLPAPGIGDGQFAEVLIRPEGMRLVPDGEAGVPARVLTARLLGRTSLVHLCVSAQGEELHLHSRVPGRFLPDEGEVLGVVLDRTQAFVFPVEMAG